MNHHPVWLPVLAALLLAAGHAAAAAPPAPVKAPSLADVQALAARIDQHIARRWEKVGATPAPRADDAEFLRRVCLDLSGRIPSVEETRTFLQDKRTNKRALLVERLLNSSGYV